MDVIFPVHGLADHVTDNFLNRGVRRVLYRTRQMRELNSGTKFSLTTTLFGIVAFMKWFDGSEVFK